MLKTICNHNYVIMAVTSFMIKFVTKLVTYFMT